MRVFFCGTCCMIGSGGGFLVAGFGYVRGEVVFISA